MRDEGIDVASIFGLKGLLWSKEELRNSPSAKREITNDLENDMRVACCQLIQYSGLSLELPQTVIAVAQVIFHRILNVKSFYDIDIMTTCMACLFLASKSEESPRSLKRVISVTHAVISEHVERGGLPKSYLCRYPDTSEVVDMELKLLCSLGFEIQVVLSYKVAINYMKTLLLISEKELVQYALNYLNDMLFSTIHMIYCPNVISCAAIYKACKVFNKELPTDPSWWRLFDASLEDILEVVSELERLHSKPILKYIPLYARDMPYFARTYNELGALTKTENIPDSNEVDANQDRTKSAEGSTKEEHLPSHENGNISSRKDRFHSSTKRSRYNSSESRDYKHHKYHHKKHRDSYTHSDSKNFSRHNRN